MITLESLLKVLADKNRLRIFMMLKEKECCVCELAYILQIKQPSVSQHLKKMKDVGLIESKQEGFWTNYHLNPAKLPYLNILLNVIAEWLNADNTIKNDLSILLATDRTLLKKK